MCGIAGIFDRTRKKMEDPDTIRNRDRLLTDMLTIIRHRGPDQTGRYSDDVCSMGMNRLSIVNREIDRIPYLNEDSSLVLAFNGEIYNHPEVRCRFNGAHKFTSDSDSEVVLHAFEEMGTDCAKWFNGMYAFAIYNAAEKELFLFRDKVGEKPLYYYDDGNRFYFASEIKSLLCAVDTELNDSNISYDIFEACIDGTTLFKDIYSLLPGEYLRISTNKVEKKKYWSIHENIVEVPDDERWIKRELTDLLVDAVELRLRNSADQIACLVSGGVDSALVAAIAKPDYIYTTTYDQYGDDYNELHYAELVAQKIGKKLHVVRPTPEDFLSYRNKIIYHLDLPATWTSFSLFCVIKELSKACRIFLTGEGIDEIFGGYHRYHLLVHDQKIHELEAMNKYTYLIDKYYGSPVERYCRLINRSTNIYCERNNRYLKKMVESHFNCLNGVVHGMGMTDLFTTLQIILHMSDRMSMAFGVENRAPFLDHRLLAFGFGMPEKYKIKNNITKHIIKDIARKFVPVEIVDRKDKKGFMAPVNAWFGWGNNGKYDRSGYKKAVYGDWYNVFIKRELGWPPNLN